MSVEWRTRSGADAIVRVSPMGEAQAEVTQTEADALKAYLEVTGNLERWQAAMAWRPIDGDHRDPGGWGDLVVSRLETGEITFFDPELFWDGVYRWFRSRGVDYNS